MKVYGGKSRCEAITARRTRCTRQGLFEVYAHIRGAFRPRNACNTHIGIPPKNGWW